MELGRTERGDDMKGLLVSTYRSQHDATNGGISSKYDQFILVAPGLLPEIFESSDHCPALLMIRSPLGEDWIAVPAEGRDPEKVGWMFGGNFVYTSDSRFIPRHPIRVHDRQETQSQYETLTK